VAVGIGLTYATLSGFLNRTMIRFGGDTVSVRSGPLPSFGNVSIPAGDVVQLFCEYDTRRPGMFSGRAMTNQSRYAVVQQYQVSCVGQDGSTRRLIGGLATLSEAKYIERTIEDRLRINPAPVAGETKE
jgi:hypothetical protein